MMVLMKTTLAGPEMVASPGQKVDVPEGMGRDLVTGGYAVAIEAAAVEPPENAKMPRPTRRGKRK